MADPLPRRPAWASEPVHIVAPDPSWAEDGVVLVGEVTHLLAPWPLTDVKHIGSTAVAGLPAKPVIDLMAAVRDSLRADRALAERYAELKRTLGCQFGGDREGYTEAKTEFIRAALLPPA